MSKLSFSTKELRYLLTAIDSYTDALNQGDSPFLESESDINEKVMDKIRNELARLRTTNFIKNTKRRAKICIQKKNMTMRTI